MNFNERKIRVKEAIDKRLTLAGWKLTDANRLVVFRVMQQEFERVPNLIADDAETLRAIKKCIEEIRAETKKYSVTSDNILEVSQETGQSLTDLAKLVMEAEEIGLEAVASKDELYVT